MQENLDPSHKAKQNGPLLAKSGKLHWAHWLVVISSLGLTLFAWQLAKSQDQEKIEKRFERESSQVLSLIEERMRKYEDALWGGVGAIKSHKAGGYIGSDNWSVYSSSLNIEKKYPGINGIGVIHALRPDQVESYLAEQRVSRPDYKIHPPHKNKEYLPITYVEPLAANRKAVGLDMAHEKNRYTAADKARTTGTAQITGPIVLVQDNTKTPGFLFYVPFYSGEKTPISESGRLEKFIGIVYAPFIVNKLMEGTLAATNRQVSLAISDGEESIYNEHNENHLNYDKNPMYKSTASIQLYGRTWNFKTQTGKSFRDSAGGDQSSFILIGGILIDGLLLLLFITLSRSNQSAVKYAEKMTESVRKKSKQLELSNLTMKEEIVIRKEAESKAEKSSRAKSEFLTSMSHELRTPLNGIIGFSEMIKEDADLDNDKNLSKSASHIFNCGHHLLTLIGDLLDLSKIESGKFDMNLSKFNLVQFFDEIEALANNLSQKNHNQFKLKIHGEIEDFYSDKVRLKQMLLNLVGNAAKFCSDGEISLDVKIDSDTAKFVVKDTGVGVPVDQLENVFDRFSQVEESGPKKTDGTGLGLSLTKDLAKLLNGDCFALPAEVGAEFVIEIPIINPESDMIINNIGSSESKQKKGYLEGRDLDVLLIDDDITGNSAMSQSIEKMGYSVASVCVSTEGLAAAIKMQPACILLDIHMPVKNGFELLSELNKDPNTKEIPVYMISVDDQRGAAQKSGALGFLLKPVPKESLSVLLTEVIPLPVSKLRKAS